MQKRYPTLTFLADARRPEGAQALFGSPIFPSSSLLAEVRWLKENADTAHRFVRAITKAMAWMRAHPAEEVLAQIPEPLRMADPDTDVESIRDSQRALSEDGVVWADGPEVVRKVLAASNEKVRTVRDITFDVPAGRFISIVGPSGCGKSTVLNVIAGLLAPSAGTVEVFGSPLTGVNTRASYMFQGDALLPWKTVLANIRLGLTFRGQTGSDALDLARVWLERVGLSGFGDRYPSQLSGGMRKRVAMAQAWIVQPDLVLMDEPFAALDVHTRLRMESEVLGLWTGSRQTVMFVTHDLEEAIALSDEVLVLSAGPGSHLVGRYAVDLARPRDLIDIKMEPRFQELFRSIWSDLRQEVLKSYERPA